VPEEKFDTILSNPPYFTNSMKCPDDKRSKARHDDSLASDALLAHTCKLLLDSGKLSVVIPAEQSDTWSKQAEIAGLYLTRITFIHTRATAAPKRVLMEFTKGGNSATLTKRDFILEDEPGKYSEEATKLLQPFYLKL
jgi:tRNA1Val (adenine37-N6)-methyltransferase